MSAPGPAAPPRLVRRAGLAVGAAVGAVLLAMPPPAGLAVEAWRTAVVAIVMATWWMSEAIPIAATSLLPLVLFPLLGVRDLREAAAPYAHPIVFLFLGGFLIALAMQRWDLHRRIALGVLVRAGASPQRLVLGFMVAAAGLSMWISNTATAMMMLPIALAILDLRRAEGCTGERERAFETALLLAIAYACSIGGIATLIGTPPNALLAAFVEETYGVDIGFARWMAFALPISLVGLACTWAILVRRVARSGAGDDLGTSALAERLRELGPMSRAERSVAIVFAATALLWMVREPLSRYVPALSDPAIAVAGGLVLFALPARRRAAGRVLEADAFACLPWGVLLLFGGGLSLAGAVRASGLAETIAAALAGLGAWPPVVLVLAVVVVVILLTELTSNTAVVATFLPALASVAVGTDRVPLAVLVPAAVAASCAFLLPVATPPNAIVFGSGRLTIPRMVRFGIPLNVLFAVLLTLAGWLWLPVVFGPLSAGG